MKKKKFKIVDVYPCDCFVPFVVKKPGKLLKEVKINDYCWLLEFEILNCKNLHPLFLYGYNILENKKFTKKQIKLLKDEVIRQQEEVNKIYD
jgi:hypothetical protein